MKTINILIINPNSNKEMTENMKISLDKYNEGNVNLFYETLIDTPDFINSYETIARVGPELLNTIKDYDEKVDGYLVACHLDPMLDAAKEITNKPVIGIGEASMKIASMISNKFSVIGSSNKTVELKTQLIKKYGLIDKLASVRYIDANDNQYSFEENMAAIAEKAVEEDGAELIVLGCAGFTGLDKYIENKIGVHVLDGVICGYNIITGVLKYKMC